MKRPFIAFFAAVLVASFEAAWASAALPPAAIVRTATPPTIDGDLSDWAWLRAEHPIQDAAGKQVASFRLQTDGQHLYAAFQVQDESPLRNTSAVMAELIKGGDAVGLCLGSPAAPDRHQRLVAALVDGTPVLIAMRPRWPVKRPHAYSSPVSTLTFDDVGPVEGAHVAMRRTEGGYQVELALPWRSLALKPSSDAEFRFDAQVIFSDPAGTVNVESAWWHAAGGTGYATEDLPTEAALDSESWGRARIVSSDPGPQPARQTAITAMGDPSGQSIRFTLPHAARASLLVCAEDGWIVRELLCAEKLPAGTHEVRWNGRDRYDEALPPGTYTWRLATFEGMGSKFLGSVGNSARPPFRTADGKGSMGGQHGGASVVAADATGIYLGGGTEEGHPAFRKIDREGYTLWKRSMGGFGSGVAVTAAGGSVYVAQHSRNGLFLLRLDPETGADQPIEGKKLYIRLGDAGTRPGGLAVSGQTLFASFPDENRIRTFELPDGTPGAEIPLPAPRGLAGDPQGGILICSENALLRHDPATRTTATWIDGLDSPRAVAVSASGTVYVSELGESQRIRIVANRKITGSVGLPGGRPDTMPDFDPHALRNVTGLAVDAQNALWTVERSSLRRTARFSADGRNELNLFGPVAYNVFGPDLDDFTTIYYQGGSPNSTNYIKARVDYDAYRADPVRGGVDAWQVESVFHLAQPADPDAGEPDLLGPAMKPGYGHVVAFTGPGGHRYLWRLAKSNRATSPTGAAIWRWTPSGWLPAAFVSNQDNVDSWSDTNGDGRVQPGERYSAPPARLFAWMARDLTLYGWNGTLKPARIDARGVPCYADGAFTPHLDADAPMQIPSGWVFNSMPDARGGLYWAANLGPHRHQAFWDRAAENQIIKVQDGRIRWIIGRHDPRAQPEGSMSTVSGIAGVVDDIVIAHIVEPAQYIAFTTDGFTLGNVIVDESGQRPKVGSNAIYIESFTGLFLKDPKTGRRVLFSVSSGDNRILEVTGPGPVTRLTGTLALASSEPRELLPAGRAAIPYETWWGNNGRGYGINAEGWQWTARSAGIAVREHEAVVGDIRLRRDAGALHLLANVLAPVPSAAAATPPTGWGTAPGVELMLGPYGERMDRPPQRGDVRIFLSADGKKTTAIAWRAGAADWEPIPGAKVAVKPRWNGYGWRLEAELPLEHFPEIATVCNQRFMRFPGGRDTNLRAYEEERPDLTRPIRLNAAFHVRTAAGGIRRIPWLEDGADLSAPGRLNPARWGQANDTVALTWQRAPGVDRTAIFRAPEQQPQAIQCLTADHADTSFVDTPGPGRFLYWLAPVSADGVGQLVGPVAPYEMKVPFPRLEASSPLTPGAIKDAELDWPRRTGILTLSTDADVLRATSPADLRATPVQVRPGTWLIVLTGSPKVVPGDHFPVKLHLTRNGIPLPGPQFDVLVGLDLMARLSSAPPAAGSSRNKPHDPSDPLAEASKTAPVGESDWRREPASDHATRSLRCTVAVTDVDGQPAPCFEMTAWNIDNTLSHPLAKQPVRQFWRVEGDVRILERSGNTSIAISVTDRDNRPLGVIRFTRNGVEAFGKPMTGTAVTDDATREWQPFSLSAENGLLRAALGSGPGQAAVEIQAPDTLDWRNPAALHLKLDGRTSGRHVRFDNLRAVLK